MRSQLKYRNKITEVDGIVFRSKGEAERWQELKLLQQAKEIWELKRQKKYVLIVNGLEVGTYTCDFCYYKKPTPPSAQDYCYVIEDFKGMKTALFILKWNILRSMFLASIQEGTVELLLTYKTNKRRPSYLRGTSASKKKVKKVRKV